MISAEREAEKARDYWEQTYKIMGIQSNRRRMMLDEISDHVDELRVLGDVDDNTVAPSDFGREGIL